MTILISEGPGVNKNNYPLVNIFVKSSESNYPKLPLVQISYSYDQAPFLPRTTLNDQRYRQPRYQSYNQNYHSSHDTTDIPYAITTSKTYQVKNKPYSGALSQNRNNYKIHDHPKQYNDELRAMREMPATSSYPYHIFDKSRSVSSYKYPFDESRYLFAHPNF